jgi:hypothetical protein
VADGEEIMARAAAMQARRRIGVAKIAVISQEKARNAFFAFATATVCAVDHPRPR